ncbi:hypothetical protein LCGC14_2228910 [marine sediment metagenome]|uniref:Uncharacterized protein n=1 Tax=marine sediment metagenome TaxID=412755 RepID=A0A0F9G422_9ZZZZ
MGYVRPAFTMTFDALIDHILEDHEKELRNRFRSIIYAAEAMGANPDLEGLAENLAYAVGYPLSDEPDVSLVDCQICYEQSA